MNYWTNPELEKVAAYYQGLALRKQYNRCLAASLRELVALRRQLGITRPLFPMQNLAVESKPITDLEKKG